MNIFSNYFFDGGFGLERETLRIDKNGRLAQTPHPFDDPHLQRDFCENQLEIITGVNDSVKNAIEELAEWELTARKKLAESGEKLLSIQILHIFQTHRKSLLPIPVWKYQNSIIANSLNRSTANP